MSTLPSLQRSGSEPTPPHVLTDDNLAAAAEDLAPIPTLLLGFVHRNHNQHRRSRWWGELGMLRRNLDRLSRCIQDAREARRLEEEAEKTRKGRERREMLKRMRERERRTKAGAEAWDDVDDEEEKQVDVGGGISGGLKTIATQVTTREENELRERVVWMKNILIPKVYLAFGQLAADNQFAPLGLLLLGVLASVYKVLAGLVGEDSDEDTERPLPDGATTGIAPIIGAAAVTGAATDIAVGNSADDFGVAVVREEEEDAVVDVDGRSEPKRLISARRDGGYKTPAITKVGRKATTMLEKDKEEEEEKKEEKKEKKYHSKEATTTPAVLASRQTAQTPSPPQPPNPTTKAMTIKTGDKSMTKSKPKRKVKPVDLDDIFGSISEPPCKKKSSRKIPTTKKLNRSKSTPTT